eukprot:1362028-Amorphochlora_amoeboformis.AAC.3
MNSDSEKKKEISCCGSAASFQANPFLSLPFRSRRYPIEGYLGIIAENGVQGRVAENTPTVSVSPHLKKTIKREKIVNIAQDQPDNPEASIFRERKNIY